MLAAIEGMIAELRELGVPVSLAERVDAVQSLQHLPVGDRNTVKAALRAVLVKNHDHELAFDTVFDVYFAADPSQYAQAGTLGQGGQGQGAGSGGGPGQGAGSGGLGGEGAGGSGVLASMDDAGLSELLLTALREANEVLMRAIASVLVDRHSGFEPGRPVAGTYYVFRTMRAAAPDRLMAELAEAVDQDIDPLMRRLELERMEAQLARFRQLVEAQVRQMLVEDRGAAAVARTLRRPLPEDADFLSSSRDQIADMRAVLDPLTRRLGGRLAAKRRQRRRGTLDFRRTVRRSLSTGGVPVRPAFRKPHPAKPELFVLADISGSVATFAGFTLQLMYAMRSQFSRVRSFVFVDGMDEVTDVLQRAPDVVEVSRQLNAAGSGVWLDGRSDYGHALTSFWDAWGAEVRRRTTVIVLGDARTNYHDPCEGALKAVSQRAGHVFWLNPEARNVWNSGDSVIARYQPFCDSVRECRNLRQLRAFIEDLD
ncbi:MAG: VWA domain-containing protein [Streptosporangiaceae bacterium]